jgi:hypothetical protein
MCLGTVVMMGWKTSGADCTLSERFFLSSFGACDALFCAMQEQWRGESSSQQSCPLQRCWRRSEGLSLLSEDRLPKYITSMRRHVVACLAPPLAAFGTSVLSACVRLKSLDREERVSVYYRCLLGRRATLLGRPSRGVGTCYLDEGRARNRRT